jgi:hypothetical protein
MLDNYVSGGSAALIRTKFMRELGGFDEQMFASEDWDMWRRLSWNHDIHFVDQVLVKYRRHNANKGSDPAFVLPRAAIHFGKTMHDTPTRLRHMLPAVKLQFFNYLMNTLVAEQLIEQQVDPAVWRAVNAERDSLVAKYEALENNADGPRAERERLRTERDALRAERDALRSDRDALRHVIDAWRRRLRWPLWVRRQLREFWAKRMT